MTFREPIIVALFSMMIFVIAGCGSSSTAVNESNIRQEERIRADEQQKIQKEQKSKDLDNELTQRGIDLKHIEGLAKSYGMDPNTAKEAVKNRLDNVYGKYNGK